MKILIVTYPFCGASDLATGIASSLGLKYFQDPLDNTVPLTVNHPTEQLIKPGETVYPVRIPRGHNEWYQNYVLMPIFSKRNYLLLLDKVKHNDSSNYLQYYLTPNILYG